MPSIAFASSAPRSLRRSLLSTAVLALIASAASAQTTTDATTPQTLPAITVNANADASAGGLTVPYAGGQVARGGRVGILGTADMMDTPFNTTAYTQQLIEDQQAQSIADVLQNDPTVRVARGFGNYQQLYIVRGFPVYSDDMAYNGLYGLLPRQYLATEFLERVEVIHGANAFLNGAAPGGSGIGGAINVVPKRAPNEPLTRITAGIESGGEGYLAADVARRFGPDSSTGIRVNAMTRDGHTEVEGETRKIGLLGVGVDWHSSNVRLSGDIGYQNQRLRASSPSVTFNTGVPVLPAPDASIALAQPWTFSNERDTFGTLRGEYDIDSQWTAWAAGGARYGKESNTFANPTVTDTLGTTTASRFDTAREDHVRTGEIGLRGKFDVAGVGNTVILSAATYRSDSRNAYAYSSNFAGSLYNPGAIAEPIIPTGNTGGLLSNPLTTEKIETSSYAIADTLSFAQDRLLVTVGARHQTIKDTTYNYGDGAQNGAYDESRVTPVAGIVFKPMPGVSLFANYIEGLVKGPTASGTGANGQPVTNTGEVFKPYNAKQKEVGAKYDGGKVGASLSFFTTALPSAYVVGNTYQVAGEQRNRGAELAVFGEAARGVRLLGGLTYLDAKQKATANGATDGRDAIGAPHTQANVGVEWDVPMLRGFTVSARAVATASQYADAANTQTVPSWTRFDLGARYVTTIADKLVTLRARVDNVADRNYWASAGGYPGSSYLTLGAPRTFNLSASVDF